MNILKLPKPDEAQIKMMASITSDLGKVFFAAGVVSYFIPSIENKVSLGGFALGFVASVLLFASAIVLIKETRQ